MPGHRQRARLRPGQRVMEQSAAHPRRTYLHRQSSVPQRQIVHRFGRLGSGPRDRFGSGSLRWHRDFPPAPGAFRFEVGHRTLQRWVSVTIDRREDSARNHARCRYRDGNAVRGDGDLVAGRRDLIRRPPALRGRDQLCRRRCRLLPEVATEVVPLIGAGSDRWDSGTGS
jgi:hypothetical protein